MLMPYMLFGRFSLFFKLTLRSSFNFFRLLSFVKIPNSLSFSLISLAVSESTSTSATSFICADTQGRFAWLSLIVLSQ